MREDVENVLIELKINNSANRKKMDKIIPLLYEDEKVLFICLTNLTVKNTNTRKKDSLPGTVVLSDKRVLFYYQAMLSSSSEVISLEEIRSINSKANGMTAGHVELHTMTKSFDIMVNYKKAVVQKTTQIFEKAKNDYMMLKNSNSNQSVAQPQTDQLQQIEKLFDLNQKGIISDEEFRTKKEQLLLKL